MGSPPKCSGSTYSQQRLPNLPADVVIDILGFLRPCDIIEVRKTCKLLHRITVLTTVWINALRTLMEQRSIPKDTFPVHELPVDLLEHIALSPHRVVSLVKKSEEFPVEPMAIRVLSHRLTKGEKDKYGIKNMGDIDGIILAHGGRYMVSLSVNPSDWPESTLFTLWDLGVTAFHPIQVLTRFSESRVGLELHLFFPDPEKPSVFFIVSVQRSSPIIVLVHQVLLSDPSSITFLTTLEIPTATRSDPCLVDLMPKSRKVIVSLKRGQTMSFWIWDFWNNTGARLVGPQWPITEEAYLLPFHDTIIFASKDKIAVYNIPPTTCSYLSGQIIPKHEASHIVEVPSVTFDAFYIQHCVRSPTSQESADPCHLLRLDSQQLTVLEIIDIPSDQSLIPKKHAKRKGAVDVSDVEAHAAARDNYIDGCDRCICISGFDSSKGASICMMDVRLSGEKGTNVDLAFVNASLGHSKDDAEVEVHEFCPILGRGCVLTTNGQVTLFDYLLPR
ncbi:hypothetical protein CVT26_006452 [Gymnopilus dilepis]|uniref:F-box domain-containing protein n=1 Tax=Gymnopilus dilepis TaxID=231916 RepID=A0A409Y1V8_9AGAR|nr:hypothetical protein CVT26_006452 [Gymnopilus dilepis]